MFESQAKDFGGTVNTYNIFLISWYYPLQNPCCTNVQTGKHYTSVIH